MKTSPTSLPLPESWRAPLFLGAVGLGAAGQWLAIAARSSGGVESQGLAALLAVIVPVVVPLLFWRASSPRWLHVAIATGALGGLGMVLGRQLDRGTPAGALEFCILPGSEGGTWVALFFSWTNALMLLACLGACLVLSPCEPTSGSRFARGFRHVFCLAGMWLGMIVGGRLLPPLFAGMVGEVVAVHVAMIAGMMIGAAAIHATFWRPTVHRELKDKTA